ncbi:MAG: hypothetical protein J07HQX50_02737, partial [Haloquadratum sp. J07HQX50]
VAAISGDRYRPLVGLSVRAGERQNTLTRVCDALVLRGAPDERNQLWIVGRRSHCFVMVSITSVARCSTIQRRQCGRTRSSLSARRTQVRRQRLPKTGAIYLWGAPESRGGLSDQAVVSVWCLQNRLHNFSSVRWKPSDGFAVTYDMCRGADP